MGLLKVIKYSTFEVSILNGIVDEQIARMNISRIDFMQNINRFVWTYNDLIKGLVEMFLRKS